MGYGIRQTGGEFFLGADVKEQARRTACEALAGGRYAYVRDDWAKGAGEGTLEEMLVDWRFETNTDLETGDIVGLHFCGENAGDEHELLKVLAPFVRAGSMLTFNGDDGDVFGYFFDGHSCQQREARIEF